MQLELTATAERVLRKRYLQKDDRGPIQESPPEMFRRVARTVAKADLPYSGETELAKTEEAFFRVMARLELLPNSPTLMNAGREIGQLSACFVLPVGDSMDSIFGALRNTALIHKSGGGTGFSFSALRPKDDLVGSTQGVSSGPVSFMQVFDAATEAIKQGGMRRGANMAVLAVDHPDILEFVACKKENGRLSNFNISVGLTEDFLNALERDKTYGLVNPRTGKVTREVPAQQVFEKIVECAWQNGEPGVLFLDRINRDNPTPALGRIEATNPCGEMPLLSFESCNLASLNLARHVKDRTLDWERLGRNVYTGVHFLDNAIDVNKYPLKEIEAMSRANRKIGLSLMGFADMLILLDVRYDSQDAVNWAERVMGFISDEAVRATEKLAKERGPFPNFDRSVFQERALPARRNATVTTIAPTGTISLIAGCSSGIEPICALAYVRRTDGNEKSVEVHHLFDQIARKEGFYSDALLEEILETGQLNGSLKVPERWKELFVTSLEIEPEWHVRIQAAFQRYVDNAVSKTVNLPAGATKDNVRKVFLLANSLGCKGVTVFRDGSRGEQVVGFGSSLGQGQITPRERPATTRGFTTKISVGCGKLYVTVNFDEKEKDLCEVFTTPGRAGGCPSQSAALSRMISIALRAGIRLDSIIHQLKGITCQSCTKRKDIGVLSCADAIGRILADASKSSVELPVTVFPGDGAINEGAQYASCRICGALTPSAGRCGTCAECGDGGCG